MARYVRYSEGLTHAFDGVGDASARVAALEAKIPEAFRNGFKAHEEGWVRFSPFYGCSTPAIRAQHEEWLKGWDSREQEIVSENAEADEEENHILAGLC
jgi:hypothetical protein